MSIDESSGPPLHTKLPPWITRWVGVRSQPPPPKPVYMPYLWAFIGAFGGLSLLQAVFGHTACFIERGVPPSLHPMVLLPYSAMPSLKHLWPTHELF
ncbi:hypothetical protein F5Y19DRAFT_183469 [Xylariaceae sp. FL1651]|nr:hypothetical protein F5Y19DRAFT_183469 [Xylariaceae sp. FL1651]